MQAGLGGGSGVSSGPKNEWNDGYVAVELRPPRDIPTDKSDKQQRFCLPGSTAADADADAAASAAAAVFFSLPRV